jgi:hypothetical protein
MKKKFVFVCCLLGTFCIGKNVKANHVNQYDKIDKEQLEEICGTNIISLH